MRPPSRGASRDWRWERPKRTGENGGFVRKDVAKHILGDDHVEIARPRHELHRRVVHEQMLETNVGILRARRSVTTRRHNREFPRIFAYPPT